VPASSRVEAGPAIPALDRPYFTSLSSWSADNFWTRGPLTALASGAQYYGFNSSSDERVLPGEDGWIFFGDSVHLDLLSGRTDLVDYTPYLSKTLSARREWLNERDIDYVYMLGPAAHSIYTDKLPWRSPKIQVPTPVETLAETINASHEGLIIAPHQRLRGMRNSGINIYHKNDSHWTQAGSAVALDLVLEQFGYAPVDWEFLEVPSNPGAFGRLMGVPIARFGAAARTADGISPTSLNASKYCEPLGRDAQRRCALFTQEGRAGRVLILGDSFGNYLQPAAARAFGETLVINLWGAPPEPGRRFPVDTIEAFKPDLIIELTAEYRAQPCSSTQLAGCSGYFGVANPFGSEVEVELQNVFSGSFDAEYQLSDFASSRSDFKSGAIRLDGLAVARNERVFAEITVAEAFNGRILGGVPGKVPNWVDNDNMIVRSSDADFESTFIIEISPEPEGSDRYIRFATEDISSGLIKVSIRPGVEVE